MTESIAENDSQKKKITQWGYEYLSSHGYTPKSNQPEDVQNTPWSYVVRFATSAGYIYLKSTPELLALEPTITRILHDQFHSPVPVVIASNTDLNCFLMKDAGHPLRAILKQHFDVYPQQSGIPARRRGANAGSVFGSYMTQVSDEANSAGNLSAKGTALFCKAIDQYTSIQLAVADRVDIFLDIGVPDWRLDKLPGLYKQLLLQKEILIADGLSAMEISELEALLPEVSSLCKKLSGYSIKQTLVQCDFHDNNILIDDKTKNITIIDLGEIVISHPFFSLVSCLRQAKFHHALMEQDDTYIRLMDACLEKYIPFETKNNLLEAFAIARTLWFVYESLAQYRLRLACDKARFMSFQRHGKLGGQLKEFMTVLSLTRNSTLF